MTKVDYVLVVENPAGCVILCQAFKDYKEALEAYKMVLAPKVVLYKQECNTTVLAQTVEPRKKGLG